MGFIKGLAEAGSPAAVQVLVNRWGIRKDTRGYLALPCSAALQPGEVLLS